jgi:alkylation response protein AidB-like acyl-CoA dehydrogenase
MSTLSQKVALKGGEFLIRNLSQSDVFTPEMYSEEQKSIYRMCRDFAESEVLPHLDRIDKREEGLMPALLDKAAEMGLLGTSLPEEFGGMELDEITNMLILEGLGNTHSFVVAFAAHTGIGTLPILYYGTPEQKKKYLPKLATGELKACYNLTEPNAGSDALSGKTRADLSDDGKHYIINGEKCWITNSGFADVFIVFAKVDGDKFTGFIVDGNTPGITLGHEEEKMGIKGSSTRQVFYQDVKVPVENVLGEIGRGHKIAFNILNIGRIKLGACCLGGAKDTLSKAVKYATERVQFKQPIANFGAIQHKLAEMAIRTWTLESAQFRASGDIQNEKTRLLANGHSKNEARMAAAEEFAAECALLKVYGSETIDFLVDEGVQIFGGNGFSADYPMDRAYRDSRINRIFEGTNEINRMLAVGMIIRRALKGELDLMSHIMSLQGELTGMPSFNTPEGPLGKERVAVENFKKAVLLVSGAAVQKFMDKLTDEQEIVMNIADMAMDSYLAESLLLRTEKIIAEKGEEAARDYISMTKVFVYDAAARMEKNGKDAVGSFADADMLKMMNMGLKRFTKTEPMNVKALRRSIAARLIEANDYAF